MGNLTEDEEFGFEGAEFDQRDYERETFSKGYSMLNTFESRMYGQPDFETRKKFTRRFMGQVRTLANMIMRYAEEDQYVEDALKLREHVAKELYNMSNAKNYIPPTEVLDSYRDILEELRFDANFKIPETKKSDPNTAGVDQL